VTLALGWMRKSVPWAGFLEYARQEVEKWKNRDPEAYDASFHSGS
jgi:hypothetical protein